MISLAYEVGILDPEPEFIIRSEIHNGSNINLNPITPPIPNPRILILLDLSNWAACQSKIKYRHSNSCDLEQYSSVGTATGQI